LGNEKVKWWQDVSGYAAYQRSWAFGLQFVFRGTEDILIKPGGLRLGQNLEISVAKAA
jgi:hypothetical protein